jgi:hypothetical protein
MPKFYVTFHWTMSATIQVRAKDKTKAHEKALKKSSEVNTAKDGDYLPDSFEIGNIEQVIDD